MNNNYKIFFVYFIGHKKFAGFIDIEYLFTDGFRAL